MPILTWRFQVDDGASYEAVLADIAAAGGTSSTAYVTPEGEATVTFIAADPQAFTDALLATASAARLTARDETA